MTPDEARHNRADAIRRDRRAILIALNAIYPGRMEAVELFRIVLGINPEYERIYYAKDMAYLREKGYAIVLNQRGEPTTQLSTHDSRFGLTAAGTDIANAMVRDPALGV